MPLSPAFGPARSVLLFVTCTLGLLSVVALPSLQCAVCREIVKKAYDASREEISVTRRGVDVPRMVKRVKVRDFGDPALLSDRTRSAAADIFAAHHTEIEALFRNNIQKVSDSTGSYIHTLKTMLCTMDLRLCPYSDEDRTALRSAQVKGLEEYLEEDGPSKLSSPCLACVHTVNDIISQVLLVAEEPSSRGNDQETENKMKAMSWVSQATGEVCGDMPTAHEKGDDYEAICEDVVSAMKRAVSGWRQSMSLTCYHKLS